MPGERQQRSRVHPVAAAPLTSPARPPPPVLSPRPRSAPLTEEQHAQDKKRRWRPDLAPSASAELYPTSAAYPNPPPRRAGVRPRPKASGDNSLQKAAVLNSTMAQNMATVRMEQAPYPSDNMALGLENSYRTPYAMRPDGNQVAYAPMVPNSAAHKPASAPPHHLLDYDALDRENGPWVPDNDDAIENQMVYSDFKTIDPTKPVLDDTYFDPFQGTDQPLKQSDATAQKLTWEKEGYGGSGGGAGRGARGGGRGSAPRYMP